MVDVYKRISKVELRSQWADEWNAFHTKTTPGFPGIQVPLNLAHIGSSMVGKVVKVDNDNYTTTAELAVLALFESLTGTEGPGNYRWVLLGDTDYWTTLDKIRWLPGQNAVAFQVGKQEKTSSGQINPANPKVPYSDEYDFSTGGTAKLGHGGYWMCFELS